jgi:hypothetical protein
MCPLMMVSKFFFIFYKVVRVYVVKSEFYRPNIEYWMFGLKPYFGNGCTEDVFY